MHRIYITQPNRTMDDADSWFEGHEYDSDDTEADSSPASPALNETNAAAVQELTDTILSQPAARAAAVDSWWHIVLLCWPQAEPCNS